MTGVGVMPMPADFSYRDVFLRGKPRHDRYDPFRIKHPKMDVGHRAKIFAPFDALKGFGAAVAAKGIVYTPRLELERERRLQGAMLEVRRRFGPNAVFKGMDLLEGATTLERNVQIGGHKA